MTFRGLRLALAPVAVLAGALLLVSAASASVIGTLNTGSSGNWTISLTNFIFNADPAAIGGGNSDVAAGTNATFAGCASGVLGSPGCLGLGEGVTVNNADLSLTAPSAANANTFLTFAAHPILVYSMNWPPGPGSPNTNCATANTPGSSCSLFAGSGLILTDFGPSSTFAGLSVAGNASDSGVGGLATGSSYKGGFSTFLTALLPDGTPPTPTNIQHYFCPSFTCTAADFASGRNIVRSQSGSFTAIASPVPEPSTAVLSFMGIIMLLLGMGFRRSYRSPA